MYATRTVSEPKHTYMVPLLTKVCVYLQGGRGGSSDSFGLNRFSLQIMVNRKRIIRTSSQNSRILHTTYYNQVQKLLLYSFAPSFWTHRAGEFFQFLPGIDAINRRITTPTFFVEWRTTFYRRTRSDFLFSDIRGCYWLKWKLLTTRSRHRSILLPFASDPPIKG